MLGVNIKFALIALIFFTNSKLYLSNAKSSRSPPKLNVVEDFMHLKEHFPNLQEELLSQFSEEDIKAQLKAGNRNEDRYLNATELIKKYGFEAEIHTVETEDGYKPSLYRIRGKGEAVLVVHGLHSSAADWLTVGSHAALPYLLARRGYDVWLANVRGSTPDASGHNKLSAEKDIKQYWDFSWDEIGTYDLPAFIDYILKLTTRNKLKYVGHSQGTTAFFVLCSERPEYNDKISLMIALSPVVFMSHIISPLKLLARVVGGPFSESLRNAIGLYKMTPDMPLVETFTKVICGDTALATLLCVNIVFLIGGFDFAQLNVSNVPIIFAHTPGGAATKQYLHYAQEINSGKFRKFDYGVKKNLVKYGREPPDYAIEKVTAPVALFYRSKNTDWLSAYEDVIKLRGKIRNVVEFYEVPFDQFAHTDYIWAKDVKKLVYDRVLQLFEKFKSPIK